MDAPQEGFRRQATDSSAAWAAVPGRLLTLRFQSSYRNIGIIRPPLLGGRRAAHRYCVRRGLPFLIIGMIALVLGLGVFCLYLVQRRERLYLLYAFAVSGAGTVSSPAARSCAPICSMHRRCGATSWSRASAWSARRCAFVAQLFEDRVSRYRGMSRPTSALFVIGLSLTLASVIHLETFFMPR